MTDSVSHSTASPAPRGPAATAFQQARAPLPDLFANLLDKTTFAASFNPTSELGLVRAADRDLDVRADVSDADAEPVPAETDAADETAAQSQDGDEVDNGDDAADGGEEEAAASDSDAPDAAQAGTGATDEASLALGEFGGKGNAPGLSNQPNAASGVELRDMTSGPTPGEPRVIVTAAEARAAAQSGANTNQGAANPAAQTGAALKQADAGAAANAAAANPDAGGDAAGAQTKAAQANEGAASGAAKTGTEGEADGLAAAQEKHTALIRAGAERAAELHQMKLRLEAHREALQKAIAQNQNSAAGTQQQTAAASGAKPTVDLTTPAVPPATAALDAPAARPASLFTSGGAGTPAGQSGNTLSFLPAADAAGNGLEQAGAAGERQNVMAQAQRAAVVRPAVGQPVYQPAEQVRVQIQQFVNSGADRMQIKLSPASLGRVEVTLELSPDKTVQAVVYADKPETLDMLERDARVLQQAFEEAGMKFDSDGLTFRHGQSGNPEFAEGSAPAAGAAADGDDADGSETAGDEAPRRRHHNGVLDVEV